MKKIYKEQNLENVLLQGYRLNKEPFIWDNYSDQPHVIRDKAYKKSMRKKYLFDYVKLFFLHQL